MTDDTLLALAAGVLGLLLGSFLNVCILRLPQNESVVHPPSRCPRCGAGIAWYDNIPVLSWLLLRGRCRRCGEGVSVQYPLIELATGLIWAGMVYRYGLGLEALRGAFLFTILLGIGMTDARHYLIPDEFSLGGFGLGLLFSLPGGVAGIGGALLGAAVGFTVLWLVGTAGKWMFKEDAMGGGDIKMMAMIGAFLGWPGVLMTLFLGAAAGSLVFVPLNLMGHKKLVPFGVFLAMGAAISYLAGHALIDLYLRFIGAA